MEHSSYDKRHPFDTRKGYAGKSEKKKQLPIQEFNTYSEDTHLFLSNATELDMGA